MAAYTIGDNGGSQAFETGALTRPGYQLGVDTGHDMPLYIEEYGGEVESQILKSSIMKQFVSMKSVRGTDTITNDRMGSTTLAAVVPGERPEPGVAQFDDVRVKVDTIILARNNVHLLDDFQNKYDVRVEIGRDHGKEIGVFFDEAMLIQGIKAASVTATLPGWHDGIEVELAAADDEKDADKLQRAIEDACQKIEENDVDLDGFAIFVRPEQFYTLLRNDRLINTDYSVGNGNYAKGEVLKSCGVPIMKTNRLPAGAVTGHKLSNAQNNNAYDLSTDAETNAVALILHPKALLSGETIPLTSKVYYSDIELQWFIDSYLAFGVTPNRGEYAAVINKSYS